MIIVKIQETKSLMHNLATIINFCSNDLPFIFACIEKAQKFSKQIIVPVCDHFFDGRPEDEKALFSVFSHFPDCEFFLYPFDKEAVPKKIYQKVGGNNFWHSFSRYLGYLHLRKDIEYVLFLDADEIIDSEKFLTWLDTKEYRKYHVMKLANYWYFRDIRYRAKVFEDSCVLIKKKKISKKLLLQKEERNALYDLKKRKKIRKVMGPDDKPMVHHYSWVRSKEEMLKKVCSWGHKDDKDWSGLVEKEFKNAVSGKDFIQGYEYDIVEPFISLYRQKEEIFLSNINNVEKICLNHIF